MKNRITAYNSYRWSMAVITFSILITVTSQQILSQVPFDFNLFLSELEGALAKIEEEEKNKKPEDQEPWSIPSDQSSALNPGLASSSRGGKPTPTQGEQRTPSSLFLDPSLEPILEKDTTQKDVKKQTKPTKESLQAYSIIMDEFVDHLNAIKQKIPKVSRLSPLLKEEVAGYHHKIIDAIVIANQQIKSKKAYLQLFLAPPEANKQFVDDMKKLRKMILDVSTKIKKLDKDLSITSNEEAESSESLLRTLAGQYQDTDLEPVIPHEKIKIKERVISQQKAKE